MSMLIVPGQLTSRVCPVVVNGEVEVRSEALRMKDEEEQELAE
jgi:hypothetical protein